MTDEEIALQIGSRLIKSQFRVAALVAELSRYQGPHGESLPWRKNVEDTLQHSLSHGAQSHIDALARELHAASPVELLRILYSSNELKVGPD